MSLKIHSLDRQGKAPRPPPSPIGYIASEAEADPGPDLELILALDEAVLAAGLPEDPLAEHTVEGQARVDIIALSAGQGDGLGAHAVLGRGEADSRRPGAALVLLG